MGRVNNVPAPTQAPPDPDPDTPSGRPGCPRGPLISVDGITGVGKTYLTLRAVHPLTDKPILLEEFSRRAEAGIDLGTALLRSLQAASHGDPFLRGGAPLAETLILLAIKRHDLDRVMPDLAGGCTVVEGRSVDTTAVCQALQLHPGDSQAALETAIALRALAAAYRPLPDLTILLTDDTEAAAARAQHRDQCVYTGEQLTFLREAGALYERLAATDPARYRVLDRRAIDEHDAPVLIRTWIGAAGSDLGCLREPWQSPAAPCLCCGQRVTPAPA